MVKIPKANLYEFGRDSGWDVDPDGSVVFRCPNGHIGALAGHEIAKNGKVFPSVMCPMCEFHSDVQLLNWKG